jgi:hypothetical protein
LPAPEPKPAKRPRRATKAKRSGRLLAITQSPSRELRPLWETVECGAQPYQIGGVVLRGVLPGMQSEKGSLVCAGLEAQSHGRQRSLSIHQQKPPLCAPVLKPAIGSKRVLVPWCAQKRASFRNLAVALRKLIGEGHQAAV